MRDADSAGRYLATQGEVVEIFDKGAAADIDALAKKYLGEEKYPFRAPGEGRVSYKIRPLQVSTMGS